jgi:hypothetical protein
MTVEVGSVAAQGCSVRASKEGNFVVAAAPSLRPAAAR